MYCPLDRRRPCPFPLRPTETYLGEDDRGYYVMEGFFDNLGNMFKRMVKFTPKSFTPGNIYKGFVNTTLTVATGGIYQILPKSIKQQVYKAGQVAIPVIAGGVAVATLAPSVMSVLGPKLSTVASVLKKNISSIGKGVFDVLLKLPQSKQTEVAQQMTTDDIVQAEQTGQLPPHIQALIEQAERQSYQYAAAQSQQLQQAPAAQSLVPPPTASEPPPDPTAAETGPSMMPILAVAGLGLVVLTQVGRRR